MVNVDKNRRPGGWYWEVIGPKNVLRSRSLGGGSIEVLEVRRPPREERPAPAEGAGPGRSPLHFRIQQVTIGRTPVVIVVSAPRSAVNGPLREAMTTLAISLAVLGIALVLAIVLQVRLGFSSQGDLETGILLAYVFHGTFDGGPRAPLCETAADNLQIDQRVAARDRAPRAAIQIVPSPVKQAPQLEIAEV